MNEIADIIRKHGYIAIENVSNQQNHPGQKMFILNYKGYAHCVPFVEDGSCIFLKTAFASRFYHKKFGGKNV